MRLVAGTRSELVHSVSWFTPELIWASQGRKFSSKHRGPMCRAFLLSFLVLSSACQSSKGTNTSPTGPSGSISNVEDEGKLLPSAIGEPDGDVVTAEIGAAGGSLASEDGRAVLTVPPSALQANTQLTIRPIVSTAPGAIGRSVRIEKPSGVEFLAPVQIAFTLTERDLAGVDLASLGIGFQNTAGFWEKKPATYDSATRTLKVSTTHLSDWSALAGRQLAPASASVQVGAKVDLQVTWCEEVSADQRPACVSSASTPCLVAQCRRTSLGGGLFSNWSVNAVPNGNAQFGTLAASGSRAAFTAPAKKPEPATVAVSVRLDPGFGDQQVSTMVSNLTITDEPEYTGTFYFFGLLGGTYRGDGRVTLRRFEDLPDVSRYEVVAGEFYVNATYPDCDEVKDVRIDAGVGETDGGALVVFKANSGAGKNYFWNAASVVKEVPMQCGDPRTTVMTPITIALFAGSTPYTDPTDLYGKDRNLPLGGKMIWFFETTAP